MEQEEGGLTLPPQQVVQVNGSSPSSLKGAEFPQPPPAVQIPKPDPRPPLQNPWTHRTPGASSSGDPGPNASATEAATDAKLADDKLADGKLVASGASTGTAASAGAAEAVHAAGSAAPAAPAAEHAVSVGAGVDPQPTPPTTGAAPAGAQHGVQLMTELPGRRRSLLVGINYFGTSSELSGCVNDVLRVRPVLADKWGFKQCEESQRVLLDSSDWPQHLRPTLANMRAAIDWLAAGAATGDALYLHYSGHGGREPRHDGVDGYHETLCPVDYESAGMLVDTELFDRLVKSLPAGCRLTCVLDCCHSAGALDLPYVFTGSKENLDKALAGEAMDLAVSKSWAKDLAGVSEGRPEALLGDIASMGLGLWELYKKRQATKGAGAAGFAGSEAAGNAGLAVGEVIAFTGCRSDQTSADVGNVHEQFSGVKHVDDGGTGSAGEHLSVARVNDHAGGALTAVFLESLAASAAGELTYLSLLERMRQRLQSEGFSQVPQLASSLLLELQQRFSLTTVFVPPAGGASKGAGGGFDSSDAALLGGMGSCAAGFLAALAATPHGGHMIQGAQPFHEWHREGGVDHEQPFHGWVGSADDRAASSFEPWGGCAGERPAMSAAAPLERWGGAEQARDLDSGVISTATPLQSWGGGEQVSDPVGAAISATPSQSWAGGEQARDSDSRAISDAVPLQSWGGAEGAIDPDSGPISAAAPLQSWGDSQARSLDGGATCASEAQLQSWGDGADTMEVEAEEEVLEEEALEEDILDEEVEADEEEELEHEAFEEDIIEAELDAEEDEEFDDPGADDGFDDFYDDDEL